MLLSDNTLRKLDAFALSMREHARGGAGGLRRARTLGSSVEFSDFRSYAPGDDLRRVDWNAFARFDKLFLKLFLDEQETTLRVLLDASASMRYGALDKWSLAIRLAAALSYMALTRYDRVMVVALMGEGVTRSRLFGGRAAYAQVEAFLTGLTPGGETHLNQALLKVPITAGRGLCVLLSDLLTPEGWTQGATSLLYRRQELSVLHILAPEEIAPDMQGAVQLLDAEGGPPCDVMMSPDALKRYESVLDAFLAEQRQFCFSRGAAYLMVKSDMPLEGEILRALLSASIIQAR